jgi:hypothetical protein
MPAKLPSSKQLEELKFEQLPDLRGASTYHVGANLATGDCVVLNHLDELKVQVCFVVWRCGSLVR